MLGYTNNYEGIPTRLYRSAEEIREQMERVAEMVSEVNERLNVRSMLMWLITEYADAEPCRWIPELEDTLARAQDAVRELEELKAALEDLRAELAEARWAVGV